MFWNLWITVGGVEKRTISKNIYDDIFNRWSANASSGVQWCHFPHYETLIEKLKVWYDTLACSKVIWFGLETEFKFPLGLEVNAAKIWMRTSFLFLTLGYFFPCKYSWPNYHNNFNWYFILHLQNPGIYRKSEKSERPETIRIVAVLQFTTTNFKGKQKLIFWLTQMKAS